MERFVSFPWGALTSSAIVTTLTLVAILALGVPAWILLPATLGGAILHTEMGSWVKRRRRDLG
jgi:hypothetical protein